MSIGSRKVAQEFLTSIESAVIDQEVWKQLGSGGFRDAYLHVPTDVVYKYEHSDWDTEYGSKAELRNARALKKMQWSHVRIPQVSGYNINGTLVLAMEHVTGTLGRDADPDDYQEHRREIFEKARFHDMHGENFFFDHDGYLVPIDMGAARGGSITSMWSEVDRRVLTCGGGSLWGKQ